MKPSVNNRESSFATNFPTTNSNVQFYWVDGGSNRIVQCSAMVDGIIISNQAVFNVLRPIAKIIPQTTSVKVQFKAGVTSLIFAGSTNSDGIIFPYSNNVPVNFSGLIEWVQVDTSPVSELEDTNLANHVFTEEKSGPYLDTTYPYMQTNFGYPVDSPNIKLSSLTGKYTTAIESDTMEMWLLFQPTNGIPVPLRAVNWYWSGTATNNPSGTDGWGLESGTNTVNPADFDTETYPVWNDNVINGTWIPPLL
jgi:hypothetical protein